MSAVTPKKPSVCDLFRTQVTQVLSEASANLRNTLRGHYLFTIDGLPSFVVDLAASHASSGEILNHSGKSYLQDAVALESAQGQTCAFSKPIPFDNLEANARVHVTTDTITLERLLQGTIKAKKAFLAGKVKIEGDLPVFLKLVSFLKEQGIKPPGDGPVAVPFHFR